VELQGKSKFFPNSRLFEAFMSSPNRAFKIYRTKIEFLHGNSRPSNFKINALNNYMEDGKIPYFVINGTLGSKDGSDWLSSVFEFTPIYMGNPELGFSLWDESNQFDWSEATTISAANIKFKLLREIPNYSSKVPEESLGVSDGGHSENLGVISLIRRGVNNIIVLDATHNIDYDFFSYKRLKNNLKKELNLDLSIPDIDDFIASGKKELDQSVFKGTVSEIKLYINGKLSTKNLNIYFVKMSLSMDMEILLESDQEKGKLLNQSLLEQTCTKFKRNGDCKKFDHTKLVDFESMDLNALSKYWVKSYSNHINNHKIWKLFGYKFPHTTTKDQTFYPNQLAAFIGLGYLQASKIEELIAN
jgi:hypothetical protein